MNYYAGSSFAFAGIGVGSGSCKISEYVLNTELFEEDDADDNKLFAYSCGDIVFEAVGAMQGICIVTSAKMEGRCFPAAKKGMMKSAQEQMEKQRLR